MPDVALVQLGLIADHQPMGATEAICALLRKGFACGHGIYIASLAVEKAFNQLEAWVVEEAVQDHDAPAWAISAVPRKLLEQLAWPASQG